MRMEKKFKLFGLITMAALSLSMPGLADGLTYDFAINLPEGRVNMEVEAEKGDVVSVLVLPENVTKDQLAANPALTGADVAYVRNEVAGDNKKASFSFVIDSGRYNLNITSDNSGDAAVEVSLVVPEANEYADLINLLKGSDKTAFLNTVKIENNKALLGFDIDIYSDKAVERLFDEYKDSLLADNYDANLNAFKKCAVIEAVNSGTSFDTVDYIKDIYETDTALMANMEKYITSDEIAVFFADRMESASGKNIQNMQDLLVTAKEAIVLTVVKYPVEDDNIRVIMTEYKDILGLNGVTTAASIYRGLSGNTYANADGLVSAYQAALSSSQGTGGSSGGGGGGGGGGAVSKPNNKVTPESNDTVNTVPLPSTSGQTARIEFFDDIDSVEWAKEAINALYKAGVVSGKEDGKFFPQDNVLREEFVKMLVATFDIKLVGKDMPFGDVDKNAWYYDYVRTAYIAGAVSGMSDSEFGIGQKITRQDICVMVKNMAEACDFELAAVKEKINFSDEDEIAGYAKDAVTLLQTAGIINGSDGKFNPRATATRAETAKIMHGILELLERG